MERPAPCFDCATSSLVSCFFKSSVFSSGHGAWKAPPHLKMRDNASDTLALPYEEAAYSSSP
jgi:hypothetical protein